MKKSFLLISFILISLFLFGCTQELPKEVVDCQKIQAAVSEVLNNPENELQLEIDNCVYREAIKQNDKTLCEYIHDSEVKNKCLNFEEGSSELCKNDDFETEYVTHSNGEKVIQVDSLGFSDFYDNPSEYLESISDLDCLEYIAFYPVLSEQTEFIELDSFESLKGLKNLKVLHIEGTKVSNLNEISGLVNIEELNLETNTLKDISGIKNMSKLRELNIGAGISGPLDLSPLKNLVNLQKLNIKSNVPMNNLGSIEGLDNLRELSVSVLLIDDISSLTKMSFLEKLDIVNASEEECGLLKNSLPNTIIICNNQVI